MCHQNRFFLILLFVAVAFMVMGYLNIHFLCQGKQLMKILGFNFSGDQKSNNAEFLQNFWGGFDLSRIFEGKVTKLVF